MPIRATVGILLFSLAACRAPDHEADGSPLLEELRLIDPPLAVIGGSDERDGYSVGSLAGAVVARSRIIIADGLASEVRFFDRQGNLVHRTGRPGSGPGEYRKLHGIAAAGDSLVTTWDPQLQRVTFVSERETRILTPGLPGARSILPQFVGAIPSGEVVFRDELGLMEMRAVPSGKRRDTVTYHIVDGEGRTTRMLRVPGDEVWFANSGSRWTREPLIFGKQVLEAINARGLILGETDRLEFFLEDGGGGVQLLYGFSHEPVSATPAAVEAERQRRIGVAQQSGAGLTLPITVDGRPFDPAAFETAVIESLPASPTLPAFSALYGAGEGFWYCTDEEQGQLCTEVTGGVQKAQVRVPATWHIHGFGDREVLVSRVDGFGRVTVLLYSLGTVF